MAVSDSEILIAIKRGGPMTTDALRRHLDISPQGMRQRLALLAEDGLVQQVSTAQDKGRAAVGRPAISWSLTAAGHSRFPDGHADLTAELIGDLRDLFGTEGLERLIAQREATQAERYRQALADSRNLQERLERLTALRSAEGYMAELTEEPDGSFLLSEHHCPICAAATACLGFCRAELELFVGLLAPEAEVQRCQHLLSGDQRCVYRVRPLPQS
ncbi:MAG: transcriptional regulator [Rhodospirillales bacterium]